MLTVQIVRKKCLRLLSALSPGGRSDFTVFSTRLTNINGVANMDSNNGGTPGGTYVLGGDPTANRLFRLFGDANGDGAVSGNDFN